MLSESSGLNSHPAIVTIGGFKALWHAPDHVDAMSTLSNKQRYEATPFHFGCSTTG